MTHASLKTQYDINWDKIIEECDQKGDGVIDFQEFMSACINRQRITSAENVKIAFQILDYNNDGKISIDDFNDIFCSYSGMKINSEVWNELLKEADHNRDGVISEDEFTDAMCNIIRKSLKKQKKEIAAKIK